MTNSKYLRFGMNKKDLTANGGKASFFKSQQTFYSVISTILNGTLMIDW